MPERNLVLLGATGKTGQLVAAQARERGHRVTAVVRAESSFPADLADRIVQGDPTDVRTVEEALEGHDVVLSCLGLRRRVPSNPWSKVISPPDLCRRSASAIVEASTRHDIARVIAISAAGVGDSLPKMTRLERAGIRISNIAVSYRDFNAMERVFAGSGLDCLLVRPVKLTDADANGTAAIVERCTPKSRISREAVAAWMLDAVDRRSLFDSLAEMIGETR